jgi:hypothetical protein
MSAPEMPRDPQVSQAFRDLGNEHGEPAGDWQAKVWSRIAREPQERRSRRLLRGFQLTTVILGVLVLVLAFFGQWAWTSGEEHKAEERKAKAALAAYQQEVRRIQREIDEAIAAKEQAYQALLASKDIEDKARLQEILAQKEKELHAKRYLLKELRDREAKNDRIRREKAKRVNVKCDSSDPLCGL